MLDVVRRLDLPELPCVVPAADEKSWYPLGFMAPVAENQPHLDEALAQIEALVVDAEARGIARAEIVLVGFSQGACLLCEYLYRRAEPFGALVAFTGGLLGPAGTMWTSRNVLGHMPLYLGTNARDAWVPVARVRESASVFSLMGANVALDVHDDPEHGINDLMIVRARTLLAARVPNSRQR